MNILGFSSNSDNFNSNHPDNFSGSSKTSPEKNNELRAFWQEKYEKHKPKDSTTLENEIDNRNMVMTYLEMDLYSKKGLTFAKDFALIGYNYESSGKYGQTNWPDGISKDNDDYLYFVGLNLRNVYLNKSDIVCTKEHFNTFISSNNHLNLTYFKKWLIVMGYIDTNSTNPVTNQQKCLDDFGKEKYYFKDSIIRKRPFYKANEGIKFYYPVDGNEYTLVRSPVVGNEGQPHIPTKHPRYYIDGDTKDTAFPTKGFRTEFAILNQGSDIGLGRANIFKRTAPTCYFRFVKDDELELMNGTGGRKTKRKSKKAKKKSRKQKKRLLRKTRSKRSKRTRKH